MSWVSFLYMKQFERFGLLKNYITHLVKLIYKRNKETDHIIFIIFFLIYQKVNMMLSKKTKIDF